MKSVLNKTDSVFLPHISLAGGGPHPAAIHSVMDGPGILRMASISKLSQNEVRSEDWPNGENGCSQTAAAARPFRSPRCRRGRLLRAGARESAIHRRR